LAKVLAQENFEPKGTLEFNLIIIIFIFLMMMIISYSANQLPENISKISLSI